MSSRSRPATRAFAVPFAIGALCLAATTDAAELVVVDREGCVYCERFEAEIAGAWPNTPEGESAPLRRVDLHGPWPEDLAGIARPTVTPTFVLLDDDGREVDRLLGYPGDEHFWFLVGEMLERLDLP